MARQSHEKPLRGVTIGAGYFGAIQMDAWQRVEGAQIVAICDLDEPKAQALADRFGVPHVYTDVEQMLDREEPDFVDIVTRPMSHLPLARTAAERGIHVLCQKPLAPSYEEGVELVEICESHGVRIMVNENWRWQPWYRETKRILTHGTIGAPFYARFFIRRGDGRGEAPFPNQPYFREMPRFLLYESMVHFIDTSRFLWGEIEAIQSVHRRIHPDIAGEDLTLTILTMANGVTVLIDANRYTEPLPEDARRTFGTMAIEGREGQMELLADGTLRIWPLDRAPYRHVYELPSEGYFGDSCRATQQHFVDGLRTGAAFETEGREYLRTFRAVFAGYESAETGRQIRLEG